MIIISLKNMRFNLEDIKRLVEKAKDNLYDGWFFPNDMIPHSGSLKYTCKKLYQQGMLERRGDSNDRWGYQYKIKNSTIK